MGDLGDDYRAYKDAQKKRRKERLPVRQQEIEALKELGYEVKKITEFQFRINDTYDLYPIHNRWHNIKTQKRGGAQNLAEFIKKTLKYNTK